MLRRWMVVLALYGMLLGGSAAAQGTRNFDTGTRILKGAVVDSGGLPVVGAVVLLKDTRTLQVRSYLTQDKGEYHFFGLSRNDEYEIRAQHGDASSSAKSLSAFDSRKEAKIDLKLK